MAAVRILVTLEQMIRVRIVEVAPEFVRLWSEYI